MTKRCIRIRGIAMVTRTCSAATLMVLAACAPRPVASPSPVVAAAPRPRAAAPALQMVQAIPRSTQQRFDRAVELLEQGNTGPARAELVSLLQQRPGERRATRLLREIDSDPRALYGSDSYAYIVRRGDTLMSIARRQLRNPVEFFGLARFNNLTFPLELQPGQTVMIPGRVRSPERAAPLVRRPAPAAQPKAEEPARPRPAATDPRRAQRLRQQGLEQMSAGSIDRAVQLLSQAAVLDPNDGVIAGELARARRIQATIHSQ